MTPPTSWVRDEVLRLHSGRYAEAGERGLSGYGATGIGADQAEAFGARNGIAGDLLAPVHPERVTSEAGIAG